MKSFNESDVDNNRIITDRTELANCPLPHHKLGLSYTATGYGAKIPTPLKVEFCGKMFRVYATGYGNSASCWFKTKGRTIYVG